MEHFNYISFKQVMGINDIPDATFSLIARSVFNMLLVRFSIDIDNALEIDFALQYAIYRNIKFIYDIQDKNLDHIKAVTNPNGSRTVYELGLPKDIEAVYKMYSPNPIVIVT